MVARYVGVLALNGKSDKVGRKTGAAIIVSRAQEQCVQADLR